MSKNWQVGEKHGDYEVIALTPTTAKFRKISDGTEVECPNIFQDKVTRGVPEKVRKTRTPSKTSSVSDLDKMIAEAEAKKARLAALKK